MKKTIIIMFLILFCVGSVWCSELEDTKKLAEQGHTDVKYSLGIKLL